MTLIDANGLVNLVDARQPRSQEFRSFFLELRCAAVTTWPAFTEADYLLSGIGGWPMQRKLWDFVLRGLVQFHLPGGVEERRMVELIERYRDRPMDLADASLVAAAETRNDLEIITQDADFRIYRFRDRGSFVVVP